MEASKLFARLGLHFECVGSPRHGTQRRTPSERDSASGFRSLPCLTEVVAEARRQSLDELSPVFVAPAEPSGAGPVKASRSQLCQVWQPVASAHGRRHVDADSGDEVACSQDGAPPPKKVKVRQEPEIYREIATIA